ncbi:MAG: Ig-like domain-containing protein [Chloroflexi bacterium]|nr:Ig-like domain-containing protein [Chloroflexota bacterium]
MQAGRASATSLLLLTLLICASCNLSTVPRFDGPPVISIAAPQPEQTFLAGTTVIVQARVENAGPDLARVAVLLDEALLGERLQPNETNAAVLPLTIDWPTSKAGQFTIAVVAQREDGSAAREDVTIEVVPRERPQGISAATEPQPATIPADTASPAASPIPTEAEAPGNLGPSRVNGIILGVANLRPGPGVASGQPIGSVAAGAEVMIVAINPGRDWYRIAYGEGGDAWIDASFVAAAEDTAGLPVETGAPPPVEDGVNLLVSDIELDPATPVCGQATTIRATIRNSGSLNSQTSPWVSAQAHLLSDQSAIAENAETTYLPQLEAGEETILEMSITISSHYGQRQQIRLTVDAGNHILETEENDNVGSSAEFELSQGDCV